MTTNEQSGEVYSVNRERSRSAQEAVTVGRVVSRERSAERSAADQPHTDVCFQQGLKADSE